MQFLTNKNFNLLSVIFIIILVFLQIHSCSKYAALSNSYKRTQKQYSHVTDSFYSVKDSVKYYKSTSYSLIAELEQNNINFQKELKDAKIKYQNLQSKVQFEIEQKGQGYATIIRDTVIYLTKIKDSLNLISYPLNTVYWFSDDYLSETITFLETDSLQIKYRYNPGKIRIYLHKEKQSKWNPFSNKYNVNCTLAFDNKNTQLKESNVIVNNNIKNKRFGISVLAGYGASYYNNNFITLPILGIGLSYTLIKF